MDAPRKIVILGAGGLIGCAVAETLFYARDLEVVAVARRFTEAQKAGFAQGIEAPFVEMNADALRGLLARLNADVIVNCVGVLQRGAEDAHVAFVARLLAALAAAERPALLVHLSIPGQAEADATLFSRSKREAERLIAESPSPHVILRPGFVVAPQAFGGSALIRALAALPLDLPQAVAQQTFAATAIGDIAATIAHVATRWRSGESHFRESWDVMEARPGTVGQVVAAFRARFGGPRPLFTLPGSLLDIGAACADAVEFLGWSPPIRSTALAEMRRGVTGDPSGWAAATGLAPTPLKDALAAIPASIQENWFARLYLLKAFVIGGLSLFWLLSGLIALTAGFDAALASAHASGMAPAAAKIFVIATSLLDIAVGVAIGIKASHRAGLLAALAVSFAYLVGATALAPALWADPLGPLVKIMPSILLTLVAWAISDNR